MSYDLIPQGYYPAVAVPVDLETGEVVWAQFGESKEKKTKYVALNFEILAGPWQGRRLAWMGYFTDKTWERTLQSMRYCGWKGDDVAAAAGQEMVHEVSIAVEHEEYVDRVSGLRKTQARIAWVNKPGGVGGLKLSEPMLTPALREFSAQMQARAKGVREVTGKPAVRGEPTGDTNGTPPRMPPTTPGRTPDPDDSVPF